MYVYHLADIRWPHALICFWISSFIVDLSNLYRNITNSENHKMRVRWIFYTVVTG